jgi:ABC-type nitrate/sulfonate/bicarbonate transport system substrate-binding protein
MLRAAAAVVLALICSARIAPAQEVRIAFPSGMNGLIVVTMEKARIAEKNGLAASFTSFQYGPPMMEALAAGSLDAVVTSLMPVTSYASKMPGDVKIVAMLGRSSHSLVVGKESGVSAPADLAGRKVGVSFGSDSHLDVLVWAKEQNLADKVELVNVAPLELATALANKSVDAIVIRQPQVLRLQQQLDARIIHTWPFRFVSIVKTKFIASRPDALAQYLDSLKDALAYVAQNHDQTAAWFGDYLRVDPAVIKAVVAQDDANYSANRADIDIAVTASARALIAKWADDAYAHKMIRAKVDMGKLFQ